MDKDYYSELHSRIAELTRIGAAQLLVSVAEADESVDSLTASFTEIVKQDRSLRALLEQLPDEPEIAPIKDALAAQASALGNNVRNSIIAFQFYDRLCQRLDHTTQCLRDLSVLEESDFEQHAEDIMKLRDSIYSKFTMEEERILYDAVLNNDDFEQAIEIYRAKRTAANEDDEDDIEFF